MSCCSRRSSTTTSRGRASRSTATTSSASSSSRSRYPTRTASTTRRSTSSSPPTSSHGLEDAAGRATVRPERREGACQPRRADRDVPLPPRRRGRRALPRPGRRLNDEIDELEDARRDWPAGEDPRPRLGAAPRPAPHPPDALADPRRRAQDRRRPRRARPTSSCSRARSSSTSPTPTTSCCARPRASRPRATCVGGVRDYFQSKIANDQNEVMKRLTAVASILLLPTFIVGLYGQNFHHIPELALGLRLLVVVGPDHRDDDRASSSSSAASVDLASQTPVRWIRCRTSSVRAARPARRPRRPRGSHAAAARVPATAASASCSSCSRTTTRRRRPGFIVMRPGGRVLATGRGRLRADRLQGGGPDGPRRRRGARALRLRSRSRPCANGACASSSSSCRSRTHAGIEKKRDGRLLPRLRRRRRACSSRLTPRRRPWPQTRLDGQRSFDHAALAARPPRVADAAAVPDQQVREASPVVARHELHQVALDLHRILLPREAEPLRQPADVRVDDDALRVAALGRDDVRRLARDARQPQQRVEVRSAPRRRSPRSASASCPRSDFAFWR